MSAILKKNNFKIKSVKNKKKKEVFSKIEKKKNERRN